MDLLSRREHSDYELRRKLEHKGFDVEAIKRVLARLQERQWQSNERFAASFFRQRVEQGYGPLRIRMEMSQKGLSDLEIEEVFATSAPDWRELAKDRYQRRFAKAGNFRQLDAKERAKRQRFLAQRGFTAEQVYAAIAAAEDDDEVAIL
ncbi:RecX family transcriptional regulator [Aliidiomarina iranensis]|uniref:Regulatory protein RecX n=1 Tax=Aliidiomarina iranensis TaxID=1434071 RepID=A0A432VSK7_9GAMM|nr:RecX family transcriptional regulator [Aliidiomarina iranensis]